MSDVSRGRQRRPVVTGAVDEAVTGRGPVSAGLDDSTVGNLMDRSHVVPPHALGAMLTDVLTAAGARDVAVWLQDYDQRLLHPLTLPGQPRQAVESIDGSLPGRAFSLHTLVEHPQSDGGHRLWVPLLDGTDRVGVLALTLDHLDDDVRGYVRRVAGTAAQLFVSKGRNTDEFYRLRRRRDLALAAEMQWNLLPPLAVTTPQVSVAGLLEPAYHIAGDSFDYALNPDALHIAIFDAIGHGLASAIMANTVVSAYRHARRGGAGLPEAYTAIDQVVSAQFGDETFVTAQLARLDVDSGILSWVNAGHPPPLLVRGHKAVRFMTASPTVPAGLGAAAPSVATEQLEPSDRLLFFTDGVVEHRGDDGEMFGEDRLAAQLVRHLSDHLPTAEVLRRLNRDLHEIIGPQGPADDATLVLLHWRGPEERSGEGPVSG